MMKTCIKKDLQRFGNEIDDLIMLEDSARGTLCAIHKSIHSRDNFPHTKHELLKLCQVPKSYCNMGHTRIPVSRSRRKSRSSSPCCDRPRMCRTLSANGSHTIHNACTKPHIYCRIERSKSPNPESSNDYVNIEKTISCPEKMCWYNSTSNRTCSITSRSSVQVDQFAQNLIHTDEVVNELKGEIAKVKHQLLHISQQKITEAAKTKIPGPVKLPRATQEDYEENVMNKLKNENRRLKREIESKRKLLEKSRSDVTKAKDILADYEKKVTLLHVQALKSSKAMQISKAKFCGCLKEKEAKIKSLKESNDELEKSIKEKENVLDQKEMESRTLNESIGTLKKAFDETCQKCSQLTETNQDFIESIEILRSQLQNSSSEVDSCKETIQLLEHKVCDLNLMCKRIVLKTKKDKESYESLIKCGKEEQKSMSEKISELTEKLQKGGHEGSLVNELQCKCQELQGKIGKYERFSEKCKALERECKKQHEQLLISETNFQKDRQEMENLIDQLTAVVRENKATLSQMTEINKQQEIIIKSQSVALLTKEEQLKILGKDSNDLKIKKEHLEQDIQELRKCLIEPCSKEACLCISRELAEIKNALNVEKDTHLLKEKIIQDQSQTILNLQSQVKVKMSELSRAQSDTKYLEEQIGKINEKLIKKHQELDSEIDEKENLIEKLRVLECQKNQLSEEMNDFEEILHHYKETCGDNKNQQSVLRNLEEQIAKQRTEWEIQKESMAKEKQKAVYAAKFATQKLLDTVEDFQRQVDAQRKVQLLLTKMLHEKDEQLRTVKLKISNINNITRDDCHIAEKEISMQELFLNNTLDQGVSSDLHTNTSIYSSCSSCCKRPECLNKPARTAKHAKYRDTTNNYCKTCFAGGTNIHEIVKVLSSNIQNIKEESSNQDLS